MLSLWDDGDVLFFLSDFLIPNGNFWCAMKNNFVARDFFTGNLKENS